MNIFVIDAGHGKNDSGAVGVNGRKEKDDNLKTAKKVRDILEAAGAKVIMTREKDTYPTLAQRVKLANESGASAFVSLHRNAYNGSAQGIECLLSVHASEKSKILAENIQKRLVKTGGRNRGVKAQAKNVYVLDKTKMPATTVELLFVDNKGDNELFDKNLNAYANDIAKGILETFGISQNVSKNKQNDAQTQEATEFFGKVTASVVNFRKLPSLSGSVIKQLKRGEEVEFTGRKQGDWSRIIVGDTAGWAFSKYISH